jgi:hypothetical protein
MMGQAVSKIVSEEGNASRVFQIASPLLVRWFVGLTSLDLATTTVCPPAWLQLCTALPAGHSLRELFLPTLVRYAKDSDGCIQRNYGQSALGCLDILESALLSGCSSKDLSKIRLVLDPDRSCDDCKGCSRFHRLMEKAGMNITIAKRVVDEVDSIKAHIFGAQHSRIPQDMLTGLKRSITDLLAQDRFQSVHLQVKKNPVVNPLQCCMRIFTAPRMALLEELTLGVKFQTFVCDEWGKSQAFANGSSTFGSYADKERFFWSLTSLSCLRILILAREFGNWREFIGKDIRAAQVLLKLSKLEKICTCDYTSDTSEDESVFPAWLPFYPTDNESAWNRESSISEPEGPTAN